MKDLEYDAVVVGAGPAGSIAAKFLSSSGVRTLVVEKRQEIGSPKRCAEGINASALEDVGVSPDPLWAVNRICGACLYTPSGKPFRVVLDSKEGYILERKIFEKHLARDAINAGARYMVKTHATDVIMDDGRVCGINCEHMGEEFKVHCKLVVAADGVDSRIAKSAGLNSVNPVTDYHSGFQYEMAGLHIEDKDLLHIYFGDHNAPKGYVWIFPKGSDVANVGVGILTRLSEPGNKARHYLDRFINNHPEIFADASPVEVNAGGIPVGPPIEHLVTGGLMVVGDAAHQVNPIHGGGIALAMRAAKLAAEVGSAAIKDGDVSAARLSEYEKRWRETDGAKVAKILRLRAFLEKLDDDDLESLPDILSSDDVVKLTEGEYAFLLKRIITRAPKILPLAKKFLAGSENG